MRRRRFVRPVQAFRIRRRRRVLAILLLVFALIVAALFLFKRLRGPVEYLPGKILPFSVKIDKVSINNDMDSDGIPDLEDIVEGAREDAENKPVYKSAYYEGGYPPDNEGVCTDVIWRAFKSAGYNLKDMVDKDIRENTKDYPGVSGKPDPNIDFRRVKNLYVFFNKYAARLTTELIPYNVENLKEWQGGDIVTFGTHIAVVSDKRRKDGIPYIIHNAGPCTQESDDLLWWMPSITGHFRYPKKI